MTDCCSAVRSAEHEGQRECCENSARGRWQHACDGRGREQGRVGKEVTATNVGERECSAGDRLDTRREAVRRPWCVGRGTADGEAEASTRGLSSWDCVAKAAAQAVAQMGATGGASDVTLLAPLETLATV